MARAGEGPRAAGGSGRPQPPDSAVGRRARAEAREGGRPGPPVSSARGGPGGPAGGELADSRGGARQLGAGPRGASATPGKRDGLLRGACFPRGFAPLSPRLPLLLRTGSDLFPPFLVGSSR